jgi:hypothetical protein
MQLSDILPKIAARIAELDTSERAISIAATGSPDTIRNWRRNVEAGRPGGATISKLTAVAEALGIPANELIGEEAADLTDLIQPGFSEATVQPFDFQEQPIPENEPRPALRRIFGADPRALGEHWLSRSIPAFGLNAGDVVVVDLGRAPLPGELCTATRETSVDQQVMIIGRFFGDWLDLGGTGLRTTPLRCHATDVIIRNPVVGILRGLPAQKPLI